MNLSVAKYDWNFLISPSVASLEIDSNLFKMITFVEDEEEKQIERQFNVGILKYIQSIPGANVIKNF